MKKLKYPVITISRQYAAYGRTVARGLSEKLGIPFYDRDVVRKTAAESGFSEDDINREGENLSRAGKFMNDLLNNAASYPSSHDRIFEAQKEVVLELAKSPCIIVGRCADHILTEAGIQAYKVFLYADEEHRISRAAQLDENKGQDPRKAAAKKEQLREVYYKTYTGVEMGNVSNYNICIDTGAIGVEKCIDILSDIVVL
ncbi:MAG: AAA family ATPase [Bilifractor sp.]